MKMKMIMKNQSKSKTYTESDVEVNTSILNIKNIFVRYINVVHKPMQYLGPNSLKS